MLDIRLFRVPTFTGAQITAFAISSGMFAQFLFLPLYLENVLGYSAVRTGVIFLPLSLRLVRRRADRRDGCRRAIPVRFLLGGGLAPDRRRAAAHARDHRSARPGRRCSPASSSAASASASSTRRSPRPRSASSSRATRGWPRASTTRSARSGSRPASRRSARSSRAGSRRTSLRRTSLPHRLPCSRSRRRSRRAPAGSARRARALRTRVDDAIAHSAFISGLNTILLVAAFVLFAGAILAFVLVRQQDFVASGPAVAAAAG